MIPGNTRRLGKRNSKWEEVNRRYINEHITMWAIPLPAIGRWHIEHIWEFSQPKGKKIEVFSNQVALIVDGGLYPGSVNSMTFLDCLRYILPWPKESINQTIVGTGSKKSLVKGENLVDLFRALTIFTIARENARHCTDKKEAWILPVWSFQ